MSLILEYLAYLCWIWAFSRVLIYILLVVGNPGKVTKLNLSKEMIVTIFGLLLKYLSLRS